MRFKMSFKKTTLDCTVLIMLNIFQFNSNLNRGFGRIHYCHIGRINRAEISMSRIRQFYGPSSLTNVGPN